MYNDEVALGPNAIHVLLPSISRFQNDTAAHELMHSAKLLSILRQLTATVDYENPTKDL